MSWTCHRNLVGELGAVVAGGGQRVEKALANLTAVGRGVVRPEHGELAGSRRPFERDRLLLGEGEVDEVRRVVDVELQALRFRRRLQRKGEVEGQYVVLVFEVVVSRLGERHLLAVRLRIGEETEFTERGHLDTGQGGPLP